MAEREDEGSATPTTETADDGESGSSSVLLASVRTGLGSDSYLLKSYAVVGTLVALFVALLTVLAFPAWVASTVGGSTTQIFSRAFLLLGGTLLVAAVFAPLLFARRRHRKGGATRRWDFLGAATGYALVVSLYLALLISAPPDLRDQPPALLAPVIDVFYGLDPVFAVAPPLIAVALVLVVGTREGRPADP